MNKVTNQADKNGRGERKRATSYDVAELAGVSQSAVSRVFQDGASASKDMRDRVLSAANKLGYRPNAIARGLITQRSNMVAVVISRQTNLYYPEVLVHLTQRFSEHGIRVQSLAPGAFATQLLEQAGTPSAGLPPAERVADTLLAMLSMPPGAVLETPIVEGAAGPGAPARGVSARGRGTRVSTVALTDAWTRAAMT